MTDWRMFSNPMAPRLNENPAANAKNLHEWLRLDPSVAKTLAQEFKNACGNHEAVDLALDNANAAMHAHGVEAIEGDHQVDRYYYNIVALYVNTGDTYNPTVIYETENERFLVWTFGDWVEANERKYGIR
jgi:hypothetical protein